MPQRFAQQRMMAEGSETEARAIHAQSQKIIDELKAKMPTTSEYERSGYVRTLCVAAMQGAIDPKIFQDFVRQTDTYKDVAACATRARLISGVKLPHPIEYYLNPPEPEKAKVKKKACAGKGKLDPEIEAALALLPASLAASMRTNLKKQYCEDLPL